MAHPRSMDIPAATWIYPNAGAQFKQNPRGVVKKLYWVRQFHAPLLGDAEEGTGRRHICVKRPPFLRPCFYQNSSHMYLTLFQKRLSPCFTDAV